MKHTYRIEIKGSRVELMANNQEEAEAAAKPLMKLAMERDEMYVKHDFDADKWYLCCIKAFPVYLKELGVVE